MLFSAIFTIFEDTTNHL